MNIYVNIIVSHRYKKVRGGIFIEDNLKLFKKLYIQNKESLLEELKEFLVEHENVLIFVDRNKE